MNRLQFGLIAIAAVAVLAIAAVVVFRADPAPAEAPVLTDRKRTPPTVTPVIPTPEPREPTTNPTVEMPTGLFTHMNEADRKLAQAVQDALDAEDLDKLKDLLGDVRKSKNAEIRRLMVEALQWFDTKAMLQIAGFLADEDEEVREAAVSAWETVLGNVEDEQIKAGLIVESLQMVQNGDDADRIASELHSLDQKLAIDSMIKLLYGTLTVSKPAREKILETYEFITGEEYTNAQAARQWLKENYTPPEKD